MPTALRPSFIGMPKAGCAASLACLPRIDCRKSSILARGRRTDTGAEARRYFLQLRPWRARGSPELGQRDSPARSGLAVWLGPRGAGCRSQRQDWLTPEPARPLAGGLTLCPRSSPAPPTRADCRRTLQQRQALPALRDSPESGDRKSTRLNSSHVAISYAVFC